MNSILFIGHDGGRTGAPIVLLHFLRWFAARHPEMRVDLLLLRGGELEAEYRKVCNVFVMPDRRSRPLVRRVMHRLKRKLTGSDAIITKSVEPFLASYDAVVGNTVATLDHLSWFKARGVRTISWIHELEGVIRIYFTLRRFRTVSADVDQFIAASGAVRNVLRKLGVSVPVDIVYEFSALSAEEGTDDVRKQLGLPPNSFIVGGCGSIEPRKGVDLFVRALKQASDADEDIRFIWVGGPKAETAGEFERVKALERRLGVEDRMTFTGVTDDPGNYFRVFDLFALTSREDPFPLVCLEAASLAKPVLCFAEAGGMPEFVGRDAGAVVGFEDVEALASEILRFKDDPERLRAAGRSAREKLENEFSMERSCQKAERLILEGRS